MKKEFFIFLLLLVLLALGIHMNQWISHPIEHFQQLMSHQPYHPLLYTFIVYAVIGSIRLIFWGLVKLFRGRR